MYANKAVLHASMAALALETLETQTVLRIGVMAAPAATLDRVRASGYHLYILKRIFTLAYTYSYTITVKVSTESS